MQATTARAYSPHTTANFLRRHLDGGNFAGRFCLGVYYPSRDEWKQLRADNGTGRWPSMMQPKKSYYVTANMVQGVERLDSGLFALCNLVIDLDAHEGAAVSPEAVWLRISQAAEGMPEPSGVVFTGRGVQIWWHIVPAHVKCRPYFLAVLHGLEGKIQEVLEQYPNELEGWSIDRGADANLCGWKRMPGSYNVHTGRPGYCLVFDVPTPTLQGLENLLFPDPNGLKKAVADVGPEQVNKNSPIKAAYLSTPLLRQTVAANRLRRLMAWAAGRGWALTGHRNAFLCICGSLMAAEQQPESLEKRLMALNEQLSEPMRAAEVAAVARGCAKVPYRWRNKTIAERLDMTPEEAEKFGTDGQPGPIMPRKPRKSPKKPRTDTHKKRDAATAAKRAALLEQLAACKAQGFTQQQAAEAVKMSRRWVQNHWHDMDN